MAKLFDLDNPIWKFMGRVADVFLLTVLWTVCSIPLVTIGASTTALYYVTLKMARNHEQSLVKSFFRSFRDNFFLSTVIWAVIAGVGGMLAAGFYVLGHMTVQQSAFFLCILVVLLLLYLFTLTVIFPLAARLDTDAVHLFLMAFMTAVKNFSWVLLMTVTTVCAALLAVFVFWPILLLGVGGVAYIHGVILEHVIFPKYGWNEE